jgi:hypothetical protein
MTSITTREELDALPIGARLRDRDGMGLEKIGDVEWRAEGLRYNTAEILGHYGSGSRIDPESSFLPATVIADRRRQDREGAAYFAFLDGESGYGFAWDGQAGAEIEVSQRGSWGEPVVATFAPPDWLGYSTSRTGVIPEILRAFETACLAWAQRAGDDQGH